MNLVLSVYTGTTSKILRNNQMEESKIYEKMESWHLLRGWTLLEKQFHAVNTH